MRSESTMGVVKGRSDDYRYLDTPTKHNAVSRATDELLPVRDFVDVNNFILFTVNGPQLLSFKLDGLELFFLTVNSPRHCLLTFFPDNSKDRSHSFLILFQNNQDPHRTIKGWENIDESPLSHKIRSIPLIRFVGDAAIQR